MNDARYYSLNTYLRQTFGEKVYRLSLNDGKMCIRDRDVPVLMTNFPTILNRLTGMFSEDRDDFIASFAEYDLLIIDDLGVELSLIHI